MRLSFLPVQLVRPSEQLVLMDTKGVLLGFASYGKNSFNVKYLENGDSYHDGVNGSRI